MVSAYSGDPAYITREQAGLPSLPEEFNPYEALRKLKLELIEQTGRIDFSEANIRVQLAELRLRRTELKRLAVQVTQLETALDIFMSGQNEKENQ